MKKTILILILALCFQDCFCNENVDSLSFYNHRTDPNQYFNRLSRGFGFSYYEPTTYYRASSPPLSHTIYTIQYTQLEQHDLLALKTNLLYDVVTLTNVALEVPIGKRWSIEGEYIGSWWQKSSSDITIETNCGHLSVNYWLGDRSQKSKLIGWHLGLYGGCGYYDFQLFRDIGAQGEFWDIGLRGGYAHPISQKLRLEYTLGVGLFKGRYNTYNEIENSQYGNIKAKRCPWDRRNLTWIGPTALKVSLVWMIKRYKLPVTHY